VKKTGQTLEASTARGGRTAKGRRRLRGLDGVGGVLVGFVGGWEEVVEEAWVSRGVHGGGGGSVTVGKRTGGVWVAQGSRQHKREGWGVVGEEREGLGGAEVWKRGVKRGKRKSSLVLSERVLGWDKGGGWGVGSFCGCGWVTPGWRGGHWGGGGNAARGKKKKGGEGAGCAVAILSVGV